MAKEVCDGQIVHSMSLAHLPLRFAGLAQSSHYRCSGMFVAIPPAQYARVRVHHVAIPTLTPAPLKHSSPVKSAQPLQRRANPA